MRKATPYLNGRRTSRCLTCEWLLLRFPGLKTLGPYRGHGQTEAEQCQHRSKSNTDVAMGHFYNTFCLYFFALFSSSALLPKGSVCLWRKEGIFFENNTWMSGVKYGWQQLRRFRGCLGNQLLEN